MNLLRALFFLLAATLLTACGGGGGGGGTATGTPDLGPTFSVSTRNITFNARAPGVAVASQTITASITRSNEISGTLYIVATVQGPAVSNVGNITITSSSTGSATIIPASSRTLGAGTHTSTISISACVNSPTCATGRLNGSPQTINVSYTVGEFQRRHQLVASDVGIAFTSLPARALLTRTISVRDTLGHTTGWSASADQSWLAVTPSGQAPGNLVITANPAGLAADTIHYGTVTLAASESGITSPERIRVALWVGSQSPPSNRTINAQFQRIIADPIRPLIYAHSGGSDLSVYNIYTGQQVALIAMGRPLGEMAISPDGARLFAGDPTNIGTSGIVSLDLASRVVGPTWTPVLSYYISHLEYVRHDGAGLLVLGAGNILNANTGAIVGAFGSDLSRYNDVLAGNHAGDRLCALNRGLSPSALTCHSIEYTDVGGEIAISQMINYASPGSNGQDLALSIDGARIYAASGAPYDFQPYTSALSALPAIPGDAYPNNVEVARDGRFFGGASVLYGPTDVWIYDNNHALLQTMRVSGYARLLMRGQMKLSSDEFVLVVLTDDPTLQFIAM